MHNLSGEQVKAILVEVIDSMNEPENRRRLEAAKEAAGNEMSKMMQTVFPTVVQMESDVIKRHGFAPGREGMVHFAQIVREIERADPEVARLHAEIRAHYLPPVSITSTFGTSL